MNFNKISTFFFIRFALKSKTLPRVGQSNTTKLEKFHTPTKALNGLDMKTKTLSKSKWTLSEAKAMPVP